MVLASTPAGAALVPRVLPTVANIVAAKGDEHLRPVDDPRWFPAEVKQELAGGDLLRTGRYGALAVLFRDNTQIRVHRNSELLVKSVRGVAGAGETLLRLERGAAWSRARSIPESLKMETPAATAGIRGTDWSLRVEDDGRTTLIVLAGQVELANAFGAVIVSRGEVAVAEVGKAPVKSVLISPRDRSQWELVITPEWVLTLNVSGLSPRDLKAAEHRLRARPERELDPEALLALAEIAYELDDQAGARRWLERAGFIVRASTDFTARLALLDGLLLARSYQYVEAEQALAEVEPQLSGRLSVMAQLGRLGVALGLRRYPEAELLLATLRARYPDNPDVQLAAIRVAALRGEHERALEEGGQGQRRFPRDSRFPVWLAFLHLVGDEPKAMRAAFEEALALDPAQYLAWQLKGVYHMQVEADGPVAITTFRHVLDLAPDYAPAWNNLARIWADLGDYERAREALRRAIRLAPNDSLYRASLATLHVVYLDELVEGLTVADEALTLDPSDATALRAMGYAALKQGRTEDAIEWMLRATVVNPGLGLGTAELGMAYYQAQHFDAAAQAIANAIRLDPNDSVAPLVGSVMAIDRFEAGQAIALAREGLRRQLRTEDMAVGTLATSDSGLLNLGSAYTSLGLTDWGRYYGLLSFDPSLAMSHLFLGNQYPSATARRGEIVQGLLLDPLAVSTRARYFDFVRRPFQDVTISASLGAQDGALTNSQSAIVQGFTRTPWPLAYFLGFQRQNSAGSRDNSAVTTERVDLAVGAQPTLSHGLLFSAVGARSSAGIPGPEDQPDPDDKFRSERVEGTLAYHRRFGPTNHLLARLVGSWTRDRFDNGTPLGSNLSVLSNSLIRAFGADGARALYAGGLRDGGLLGPGLFAGSPIFFPVASGICPACPVVPSDIPAQLDLKTIASVEVERVSGALQLRHLFEIGPARLTYGVEWAPGHVSQVTRDTVLYPSGTGIGVLTPNIFTFIPFPFGGTRFYRSTASADTQAAVGYVNGDWRPTRDLLLEAGLFFKYFDDDSGTKTTQPDPRVGVAWRFAPGHWLRLAGERDLILPLPGTLAPVAAVGLPPSDDFMIDGSSAITYQARWDAEWHRRFYTFVALEQRRLHRFFIAIPQSLETFRVETSVLQSVVAGANVFLGDRWGLFAAQRWTQTENLSKDGNHGRDLPLVPDRVFNAGLTWVHPAYVTASALVTYVGSRAADPANLQKLDGFWTVGLRGNWQPDGKRWSFTLALDNVLDDHHKVAAGIPAPGFSFSFGAEYRWDR